MYRLRDLKNGRFQLHVKNGPAYEGGLRSIAKQAAIVGLRLEEIELAVLELERTGHDYAEFGVFGRFMYTLKNERKAA